MPYARSWRQGLNGRPFRGHPARPAIDERRALIFAGGGLWEDPHHSAQHESPDVTLSDVVGGDPCDRQRSSTKSFSETQNSTRSRDKARNLTATIDHGKLNSSVRVQFPISRLQVHRLVDLWKLEVDVISEWSTLNLQPCGDLRPKRLNGSRSR
jgi:hypothetical protein